MQVCWCGIPVGALSEADYFCFSFEDNLSHRYCSEKCIEDEKAERKQWQEMAVLRCAGCDMVLEEDHDVYQQYCSYWCAGVHEKHTRRALNNQAKKQQKFRAFLRKMARVLYYGDRAVNKKKKHEKCQALCRARIERKKVMLVMALQEESELLDMLAKKREQIALLRKSVVG